MLRFKQYISEKHAKGGFDYEDHVNSILQKHGHQEKGSKSAGASADAPDGKIGEHNLEIKKDKNAMMGQIGLHHDGESWRVKKSAKTKYPATAKHVEKHLIPHMNKTIGAPSGNYEKDKKEHGNLYHKVKGTNAIKDHYGKDRKTPYIQIGKSGLHHTDHDHGNYGTKALNGDTQFRMRVKYHGKSKKTGKVSYSHTAVLGLHNHKKSHIDIEHHARELGESYLNESWFRDLKGYLHRKIHPKGYNKLLRIYIEKVNKYKQKANKGLIIRDIVKPYGPNASSREFINYINDLVKKGMLPQKFKA